MIRVAITEAYSLKSIAALTAHGGFKIEHGLPTDFTDIDALLVRSRTDINQDLLEKAKRLKIVISATSGFDHLDWRACQKRNIIAAHTPSANAQSTAELTMTLMLAWERQLLLAHKNVKSNLWREGLKRPHSLEGKTLGIIGLGRVGAKVSLMAKAFQMKLCAFDPYKDEKYFLDLGVERLGFTELLRASDIVSLHVPLTRETKHFLNHPTFHEMHSDAILINTCRGPVVDENDLMVALDEGTIAGAAMDVIEREPPPKGHRLLNHPRLLLTPHIGAFSEMAWERSSMEAVQKLIAFADGLPIHDTLPLDEPWFALS